MNTLRILFLLIAAVSMAVCLINMSLGNKLRKLRVISYCQYCLLVNVTGLSGEELAKAVVNAGIENGEDCEEIMWEMGTWGF